MNIEQLHAVFLTTAGVCTDTRKITENCIFFALKGEHFNGNRFATEALEKGASYAVIDQREHAIGDKTILVDDVLTTLQRLATFHRDFLGLPIIALTGSNGKTTTKELIHAVLSKKFNTIATKGNLNNHIGVPLTLLSMNEETEIGVVEMGANHRGEIALLSRIAKPNFGYITNFGKAHLEGFGGVEGVIKGKSELYDFLKKTDGLIFLNRDDDKQSEIVGLHQNFSFSTENKADLRINQLEYHQFVEVAIEGETMRSQLTGSYNFTNIAAAISIGMYFEVSLSDIKVAIEAYLPANNRSQIITRNGRTIVLDAYNANPSSMEVALENFAKLKGAKVAFLGDMFELGDDADEEHQYIANLATSLQLELYLLGKHFAKVKSNDVVQKFDSFEDLSTKGLPQLPKECSILIKGSRGMALERLLELL